MSFAQIDDDHRMERRAYLAKHGIGGGPDQGDLVNVDVEFAHLEIPFSTLDLYELYLADFVKALPWVHREGVSQRESTFRSIGQANAVAWANGMMLMYVMFRQDKIE